MWRLKPPKKLRKEVYLVEQLFAGCVRLDGELQLSVHCRDADIYLQSEHHTQSKELQLSILLL